MFQILNLITGKIVTDDDGETITFATGKAAGEYCQLQDFKCQPRKVVLNKNWQEEEQAKFDSGEYQIPEFFKNFVRPDHFVHVSKEKPGMLAYIKDHENGCRGIISRISLRGYIQQYVPYFNSVDRSRMEHDFQLYISGTDGLKITFDPEEMKKVYLQYVEDFHELANSCMRYKFNHLPIHPVSIYGAGDLAIAYMTDNNEYTTARSIVWPEKKIYSRVYGCPIIHDLLKKRGFRKSAYYREQDRSWSENISFHGAKLLKIPYKGKGKVKKSRDIFVIPYLDEPYLQAKVEDDVLKLFKTSQSETNTRLAGGLTHQVEDVFECFICQQECFASETYTIYEDRYHANHWCGPCMNEKAFYCRGSGNYYNKTEPHVIMWNGDLWTEFTFEGYGFKCAKSGKNCNLNERICVHQLDKSQQFWCQEEAEIHGWKDAKTEIWYAVDVPKYRVKSLTLTTNRGYVHFDSYKNTHFLYGEYLYPIALLSSLSKDKDNESIVKPPRTSKRIPSILDIIGTALDPTPYNPPSFTADFQQIERRVQNRLYGNLLTQVDIYSNEVIQNPVTLGTLQGQPPLAIDDWTWRAFQNRPGAATTATNSTHAVPPNDISQAPRGVQGGEEILQPTAPPTRR